MEPLVTLADLESRIEWEMEDDEKRLATGTLSDLSDDARFHGSPRWIDNANSPRQIHALILRAAARYLRNPDGYITSRAGDETLTWTDQGRDAGTAAFTDKEVAMIRKVAGVTTIHSVEITAWGPRRQHTPGLVPTSTTPIPYFSSDTSPW